VTKNILNFRVESRNRANFKEAGPFPHGVKNGYSIDLSFWHAPDRLLDDHDDSCFSPK
jgi:hypothetical protein